MRTGSPKPYVKMPNTTNILELSGKVFNEITVIEKTGERRGSSILWKCRCSCGKEVLIPASIIKREKQKSCGCKSNELISRARTIHGHAGTKSPTKTYNTWESMIARCIRPSHKSYKDYGGRGITVCKRWFVFKNFLDDMGERPDGRTLGRKNNSKGYSKANCRWETWREQANNKRGNVYLKFNGETYTLQQWSRKTGIWSDTLSRRLKSGWGIEKALTTPLKKIKSGRAGQVPT